MVDKIKMFKEELAYIRDKNISQLATELIELVPDYFFQIAASSTGKYHPAYALGEGGLLRHTKAAVRIAIELFRNELYSFTEKEKDLMIVSLILHDGWKTGLSFAKYTVADHPSVAYRVLMEENKNYAGETKEEVVIIAENIATHMGQWNKDYRTGISIMDTPTTAMQRFVHLCDYLASRKCIEINFNAKVVRK